jgi:hypothetical protein
METQLFDFKNWKLWVVGAGVIAFVGSVAYFWLFGNKGKNERDESSENTEGKSRCHAREWNWGDSYDEDDEGRWQ